MIIKAYPLNDTEYTAAEPRLIGSTKTSGIFKATDFNLTNLGGGKISLSPGGAWFNVGEYPFNGIACGTSETTVLQLENDPLNPVKANVVINFSESRNTAKIMVKNGTPSASPVEPEKGNSIDDMDLVLYVITVNPDFNIEVDDKRKNPDYCGIATEGTALNAIPMHAHTHAKDGNDPITPKMIGAVSAFDIVVDIPANGWSMESGYYTKNIFVSEIKETDSPIIDVVLMGSLAQDEKILNIWSDITRVVAEEKGIKVFSTSLPSGDISIKMKVLR